VGKSIIYYTDNNIDEPIFSVVQKYIAASGLPIVSVSLKPIDFGTNFVIEAERNIVTMYRQILKALSESDSTYVFFCEHDVLYPKSHFDFTPPTDDVFYYNENVWRWDYPFDRLITYERLISLSGLCCNRQLALLQYTARLKRIYDNGWDKDVKGDPGWARTMGHEPGTKKKKRGGFSDDNYDVWRSKEPLIDIRHKKTYSPPKVHLRGFKHPPHEWHETTMDRIDGWNLREFV